MIGPVFARNWKVVVAYVLTFFSGEVNQALQSALFVLFDVRKQ